MRLSAVQQQIVDQLVDDAHRAAGDRAEARGVADGIVSELHALEGSGEVWVATFVEDLTNTGAQRLYADWRRRYEIQGTTKAGTKVAVPAFGAVKTTNEDGVVVYEQGRLEGMTLAELRDLRDRKSRMRDTLSAEIRLYDALLDLMEEHDLATAGEALALMDAA